MAWKTIYWFLFVYWRHNCSRCCKWLMEFYVNKLILDQILADLIQQNLDNSNSDNSNSPLSRTKLLSLDQDFTEIYPDNSNSPLKIELFFVSLQSWSSPPRFYCKRHVLQVLQFPVHYFVLSLRPELKERLNKGLADKPARSKLA